MDSNTQAYFSIDVSWDMQYTGVIFVLQVEIWIE